MQTVRHYLNLDVLQERVIDTIFIRAGSIGHELHVSLRRGSRMMLLPVTGEGLVQFVWQTPSGVKSDTACTVTENEAVCMIPRAAVEAPGTVSCELRVYSTVEGTWDVSPKWTITVQDVIYDEDAQQQIVSDPTVYEQIVAALAAGIVTENDIDDEIDDESENPVQNKVIAEALAEKADITELPTVPVISTDILTDAASDAKTASPKAVKTYVDAAVAGGGTQITVDDALDGTSENPVQNKVIKAALDGKQATLQYDTEPTQLSNKMLTSGKLYNAFQGKQDKLTFDQTPTQNSKKPVESGGVYTALAGKSDTGHTHAYSELTGTPTIPTVPTISTDIAADAASDAKTASPKAVKTYVDAAVAAGGAEIAGAFVPNFTEGTGSALRVKQVGKTVYLSGLLAVDSGTWADVQSDMGEITGVAAPAALTYIPVTAYDNNLTMKPGYILIPGGSGPVTVYKGVDGAAAAMMINGFYMTN